MCAGVYFPLALVLRDRPALESLRGDGLWRGLTGRARASLLKMRSFVPYPFGVEIKKATSNRKPGYYVAIKPYQIIIPKLDDLRSTEERGKNSHVQNPAAVDAAAFPGGDSLPWNETNGTEWIANPGESIIAVARLDDTEIIPAVIHSPILCPTSPTPASHTEFIPLD
ncbi:MAG: hypothetical protein JWM11_65 [Planctomycetaceae bacterium]|nr:hypothetical protein [Planctomycetaceae bacterium]